MLFYVICYDTPSDKRRRHFSKYLRNYLIRTQYSVFEGFLRKKDFDKLERCLKKVINQKEDSLRIFGMSPEIHKRSIAYGTPGPVENHGYYLIEDVEQELAEELETSLESLFARS
jgi:CRISPR-associated protein Cas2